MKSINREHLVDVMFILAGLSLVLVVMIIEG